MQNSFASDVMRKPQAGDAAPSLMSSIQADGVTKYTASDIPGFSHPVIDGQTDKGSYVLSSSIDSEDGPTVFTRDEAMKHAKENDPAEVAYGKDRKGK